MGPYWSRSFFDLLSLQGGVPGLSPFKCQIWHTTTLVGSSFIKIYLVGNPQGSPNVTPVQSPSESPHTAPPATLRGKRSATPWQVKGTHIHVHHRIISPIHNEILVFPQFTIELNSQLPFLTSLNLPDISKLTNDPISHNPIRAPCPQSSLWTSQNLNGSKRKTLEMM